MDEIIKKTQDILSRYLMGEDLTDSDRDTLREFLKLTPQGNR